MTTKRQAVRLKLIRELTHTTCIAVDEAKDLWRTASDAEAAVIADIAMGVNR